CVSKRVSPGSTGKSATVRSPTPIARSSSEMSPATRSCPPPASSRTAERKRRRTGTSRSPIGSQGFRTTVRRTEPPVRTRPTTADGVTDQARRVVDIELRHDPGPVILRGLDAHAPEPSDLFRCLSLHHQLQDLALAWTQRIGRNLSLRQVRLDHGPGDARAQV